MVTIKILPMPKQSYRPRHLELRHKTYFAVLTVPKDVQPYIGKIRFFKTTGTSDIKIAQAKADIYVIQWEGEIAKARQRSSNSSINSAMELAQLMRTSPTVAFQNAFESAMEEVRDREGDSIAKVFEEIASNKTELLEPYLDQWEKRQLAKKLTAKTVDQMKSDLNLLIDYIYSTKQLTSNHCEIWIHDIARKGNLTPSSVNRIVGSCKNFYKYLQEIRVFPEDDTMPFKVPMAYRRSKKKHSKARKEPWKPFSKKELEHIYFQAVAKGDTDLVDLIYLASHSGARIEELCSLEIEQIDLENRYFEIADSKSEAGHRTVPIHSASINLMTRLVEKSKNSYLFAELTKNKYGDRSNAIGKRFGRLKKKLGFGKLHVFHSIRKTFSTELEKSGVIENVSADIVGHDKQTMTYGVYSGGTSLEQMRDAVEKVKYLFTVDA